MKIPQFAFRLCYDSAFRNGKLPFVTNSVSFRFMVIIRFDDSETEKRALDYLLGRYSFKTWANGDLMLPEIALGALAGEGMTFRVKGPATYEHFLQALRNPAPAPV